MEHNLAKYLAKHPECEVFCGQDSTSPHQHTVVRRENPSASVAAQQKRVTLWHRIQKRKVVGNAAPLEKNVAEYLRTHPEYEVYDANGLLGERDVQRAVEKVLSAIVTSVANQNRHRSPCALRKPTKSLNRPSRKPSKISNKRHRKQQMSGGKQLQSSAASKQNVKRGRAKRKLKGRSDCQKKQKQEKQEKQQEKQQQQQQQHIGLSVLLDIASRVAEPLQEQPADNSIKDSAGMLDLLVQASHRRQCGTEQRGVTGPTETIKPESPPFSPMMGPTAAAQFSAIQEMSLAAPWPATRHFYHRMVT